MKAWILKLAGSLQWLSPRSRRRADETRRAQLEQIEAIYQSAPVGLCVLDGDFRYVRVNERLAQITGAPVAGHVGRTVREVVPHLADGIEALGRQVMSTGQPVLNLEFLGSRIPQSGKTRIGVTHWMPLKGPDGRVAGLSIVVDDITERKQMEQALRDAHAEMESRVQERTAELEAANQALSESQERFRTLSAATFEGVVLSRGGRIEDCNDQVTGILGYSREELIGRNLIDFVNPDRREELGEALRLGRETVVALELRHKDGSRRFGEVRGRSPHGPEGMRLTTIRDVSEQKAAELRLAESQELNRTLIAASTVGIAAFKSTGECVSANAALARITGGTLDQLLRANFRTLEPWHRHHILPRAEEVLRTRQPQQFDVHATTSFGKEVDLTVYFASFMSHGELHLLYMVTDISERLRAGEALRASEERLRAVVEDQTEIIARFRPDGIFTFVNDAYCRLFGKTNQELVGKTWQPLPVAEDLALIEEKLRSISPAHPVVVLENRVLSGSGEIRWMQFVNRGLFDPEGRLVETQTVGRDITEQKRAEREILEISEREQARIGQDLHDGLCQQLVSLAFDANSLQRKFAAHNQPEAVIAGRLARVLDQAITESRRLARGLFPIRLQAEGLASALEELAHSIGQRFPVQCRFDCPQPVPVKDHAIATHLYRIAQEALNNSLKHARAGTLSIQLRSDAGSLELRVEDDGIGLSHTPARPGGMGLHIMHYRAATIGATLSIGRGPAGGTTVSCRLPYSPAGNAAR